MLKSHQDGLESSEQERQAILTRLLNAVKRCQVQYGGRTNDLASEDNEAVRELCLAFENALSHGLKRKTADSDVSILSTSSSWLDGTPSPWPLVKRHLGKPEMDRLYLLKNISTDWGRSRAWLRAALSERSLERYFKTMLTDGQGITKFFEPWSFIADAERSAVMQSLATGVSSIAFAINIDRQDLNQLPNKKQPNESQLSQKARKKKKKVPSQLVDLASNEQTENSSDVESVRAQPTFAEDDADSVIDYKELSLKPKTRKSVCKEEKDDLLSFTSRDSELSQESKRSGFAPTALTPVKDQSVGALIPITMNSTIGAEQDIQSEDSASVRSLGEDSDYAIVSTLRDELENEANHDGSVVGKTRLAAKTVSSVQNSTVSREELKQALLSVMRRKDEIQDQNCQMQKLLSQENANCVKLREEIQEMKRAHQESSDKMEMKVQSLKRENELLKHQLKKYVGAVQKLREGPQAYETLAELEGKNKKRERNAPRYVDYHYEASEYEKKLIQVAEMHGELIEFNEHLQKALKLKDLTIHRMREELIDLRGPLPNEETEQDVNDTDSVISENVENASIVSGPVSRALLHIWIPSVFLSGNGRGRAHHVYQVYLRIKDEEWNIYRRYSDFYKLHLDLKEKEPQVASFNFPPKKALGNKAEKVVEERRKRLQMYLRRIVNLLIQTNPALTTHPTKETVLTVMPFFSESFLASSSQRKGQQSVRPSMRSLSQGRASSIFSRNRTGSYSALPQLNL